MQLLPSLLTSRSLELISALIIVLVKVTKLTVSTDILVLTVFLLRLHSNNIVLAMVVALLIITVTKLVKHFRLLQQYC